MSNDSSEISIDPGKVHEGINKLKSSIQALETTFSKDIGGDSKLDMVEEVNECKQKYDQILERYQTLFLRNVQSTRKSTDEMVDADQTVASKISMLT